MDELTTDAGSTGDFSRRDALRRGALVVGAATLWTTPVVQTLGMRAAAAGTDEDLNRDFCPTSGPNNQRVTLLTFQYLGADAADIVIEGTGPGGGTSSKTYPSVEKYGYFSIERDRGMNDVRIRIRIIKDGSTQVIDIHTSCSSPLLCGTEYRGLVRLVGGKDAAGDPVDCSPSFPSGSTATTSSQSIEQTSEGEAEVTSVAAEEGALDPSEDADEIAALLEKSVENVEEKETAESVTEATE
jgi:hypothetical protein